MEMPAEKRPAVARNLPGIYMELAKIRLSMLVVATAFVGYVVAGAAPLDWPRLAWTLLGTTLTACGVNILNQWMEAERDGRMLRTRGRPLPAGAIGSMHALIAGAATSVAGPLVLACQVNALAAALAVAAGALYIFVYTPLKVRNSLCTLVGAVVGALPPMIGWAAATGGIGFGAFILAGVLFIWQIPHFLSLAWLCREDYARGGFRMLPVVDPSGRSTFRMVVLYSLALLPVGLAVIAAGIAGWTFGAGSIVLGGAMLALGVRFYRSGSDGSARRLFFASLLYLPLLLGLMVADRGPVETGAKRSLVAAEAREAAALPATAETGPIR